MSIFGTIGVFVSSMPFSSGVCAFSRAFFGFLFILVVTAVRKDAFDFDSVKRNIVSLAVTGVLLGSNWILLFAAYDYVEVPTATVCYYMAPIFLIILTPFVLGEKLSLRKLACVAIAFIGVILVSGVSDLSGIDSAKLIGIGVSLIAAVADAGILLLSKRLTGVSGIARVTVQLAVAAVMLFVYVFATEGIGAFSVEPKFIPILLIIGIVHTGFAYILFYDAIAVLDAQSFAIFSYADPIVALAASAIVLGEVLSPVAALGAALILGATFADGVADALFDRKSSIKKHHPQS